MGAVILTEGHEVRSSSIWLALRIAAATTLVVSTFGYAITGNHSDVLMGAGCGIAIGVGVGLRGGSRSGLWTGILIGSVIGMAVALVAGGFSGDTAGVSYPADALDRSDGRLAEYLRAMWVPIGGFAVGYLTIIVLFGGFCGTLQRFSPGAFAGIEAGSGITDWLSFSFFTALGQDFLTVAPVSVGARVLVGVHLIFSAGWAVVLFAAVMSSIGPKLDRIARRHAEEGGE